MVLKMPTKAQREATRKMHDYYISRTPNSLRHLSMKVIKARAIRAGDTYKPPAPTKKAVAKVARKGTKTGTGRTPKTAPLDYAAGMANQILYSMASEAAMNP